MLYFTAFTLGLVSSLHCMGMCGPLALALPGRGQQGWHLAGGRLLYNLGRSLTYALMGGVFGVLGLGAVLVGYQQQLSVLAGVLMLLAALLQMRGGLHMPQLGRWQGWVQRLLARQLRREAGPGTLLALGLLNGLLPCGVVYIALAGAVGAGSLLGGMAFMALFGLGTTPLMWALSMAGARTRWTLRLQPWLRPMTLALAALLIFRGLGLGIPYLSPQVDPQSGLPACCRRPASTVQAGAASRCVPAPAQQP